LENVLHLLAPIKSVTLGEWLGFIGELLVALVIYWELKANREAEFLKAAFEKEEYVKREPLYRLFFNYTAGSWRERGDKLAEDLFQENNLDLKIMCGEQLWRLDSLGHVTRPNILRRIVPQIFWRQESASFFPHSILFFWVMLRRHVILRRAMTGPWWAHNFLRYTTECTEYILRSKVPSVTLYDPDRVRKADIVFSRNELRKIKRELRSILKNKWCDE